MFLELGAMVSSIVFEGSIEKLLLSEDRCMNMIKKFFNDESGATVVEYALLVALIAVAVAATVVLLGGEIDARFNEVKECIADPTEVNCTPS